MNGNEGNDQLQGGDANDTIMGLGASDTISGGAGDDALYGNLDYSNTSAALGSITYRNGGRYVSNDGVQNTLELPDDLENGDKFWTIFYDGKFTKAIQLEYQTSNDGSFSLSPTSAKYTLDEDGSLFAELDEDYDAIQSHFNNNGTVNLLTGSETDPGYGIYDISIAGTNFDGYLQPNTPQTFDLPSDKADSISGGDDNDLIYGDNGHDTLAGDAGNDTIHGGVGHDEITGGDGDDEIYGEDASIGTLTYRFGGSYLNDHETQYSLDIPSTIESGDTFWVVGYEGDKIRAIKLEYTEDSDGNVALRPLNRGYRTDTDKSNFNSINGDFDAIQKELSNLGTATNIAESATAAGYGLHKVSFMGQTHSGYLTKSSANEFGSIASGNDTIAGGAGNDTIDAGRGDDSMSGGEGDDTFLLSDGEDTISDFTSQQAIGDTQSNIDFVDLSGHYNAQNLAKWNEDNPDNQYATARDWMKADHSDDGVLDDTQAGWSAQNTLSIQNAGEAVSTGTLTYDATNVVCFCAQTLIETSLGPRMIGTLAQGDLVLTRDHGYQAIRWIGKTKVSAQQQRKNPKLRPVCIQKNALGNNHPNGDLVVSRQHRILVRSAISKRMFEGSEEVLVPAKHLTCLDGIETRSQLEDIEYVHILFDRHEIIFSNGALTESFFAGTQALDALGKETRQEIFELFPELHFATFEYSLCRKAPGPKKIHTLLDRHQKNTGHLLQ